MWTRSLIKARAKNSIYRNYWKCVIAGLIAAVIIGTVMTQARPKNNGQTNTNSGYVQEFKNTLSSMNLRFSITGGFTFTILNIFVFNILEIGCDKFFVVNSSENAELDTVLDGFRNNYGKNVLTMFLRQVYITLWSFLFVIPGIMKAYSYTLVPYILAESPDISRNEAITLSKNLMNGHRMNVFILDLSFLGWQILTAITGGLAGIFFVFPYQRAARAELYLILRNQH